MPFPSAETTPPVMKMKRVSGRLWGINSLGSRVYSSRTRRIDALTPPPAGPWRAAGRPCRWPRRRASGTAPPTTPSPSSASTVVSAVSVSADFSIRKCALASAAICGRWVMQSTWRVVAERAQPLAHRPGGLPADARRRPRRTRACATRPCRRRSSARASRARARRRTPPRGSARPGRPGWARA